MSQHFHPGSRRLPAFSDPLDWLSFPPDNLDIQVVIGHGAKLGRQAQIIRKSHRCKWLHVVHTETEELAMHNAPINVKPQGGRGGGGYPREID